MIYGTKYWGPKVWYMLHSFSTNNNLKILEKRKHNYYLFYTTLLHIIPCKECSDHYEKIIYEINPIEEQNIKRKYMVKWVYDTHNIVNGLLDKKRFIYKKCKEKYCKIDNEKIFMTINILINSIDFENISLMKYDNIYNFFIQFCKLYPDKTIRTNLKEVLKSNHFHKIKTPKQFKIWFNEYFLN